MTVENHSEVVRWYTVPRDCEATVPRGRSVTSIEARTATTPRAAPVGIRDGSLSFLRRPCGRFNSLPLVFSSFLAHVRFTLDCHTSLSRWIGTARLCLGVTRFIS